MDAREVRLEPDLAERLAARAQQLAPLGSLSADAVELSAAEHAALTRLTARLANTYPYGEPRYVGQMLKPPHPIAWAAYATAMLLNPNNHALDGGPATAAMEREAVAALAGMLGQREPLGHLTSSGTIANLEALWVARELRPGAPVLIGENAHYTHLRMCAVLGIAAETLPQDERGRLDLDALEARLRRGGAGTVVATLGTTALGALDPVGPIADLCERHGARLHVDAAYGGFYALLADGGDPGVEARRSRRSRAPTRSSSTRTSMAYSPTAAAASSSPTRRSDRSTHTTRPTRTSPRRIFTSARSASSAAAPERRRRRCGRRSRRSHSHAPASVRSSPALATRRWRSSPRSARRWRSSSTPELDIVCPFPAQPYRERDQRDAASAHSTRSRRPAGMRPSCASTPPGYGAVTRGFEPTPTRSRPCGSC